MGLFGFGGKEERPEIHVPSAEELLGASSGFISGQFPQFFGARETGLEALLGQGFDPQINIPQVDFSQFGPTSFEQGIATSGFGPLLEQARRQALQIGSLSGIPSAAPAHFGRAIGPSVVNIGNILAQLQQQRGLTEQARLTQQALSSEQARQFQFTSAIGQDPFPDIFGGAQLGAQQAQRLGQEQLARFQAEEARQGGGSTLTALLGAGLGAALAPFTGGLSLAMGAGLGGAAGGTLGSLFGGGPSPIGFQDVALMSSLGGGGGLASLLGGAGGLGSLFGGGAGAAGAGAATGAVVPVGGF